MAHARSSGLPRFFCGELEAQRWPEGRFAAPTTSRSAQRARRALFDQRVAGAWFQVQDRYGFHGIHNHGNRGSGVCCVQLDPPEKRQQHPVRGAPNGIIGFYARGLSSPGGVRATPSR